MLGELPLVADVSEGGDLGTPFMLTTPASGTPGAIWKSTMQEVAKRVWDNIVVDKVL